MGKVKFSVCPPLGKGYSSPMFFFRSLAPGPFWGYPSPRFFPRSLGLSREYLSVARGMRYSGPGQGVPQDRIHPWPGQDGLPSPQPGQDGLPSLARTGVPHPRKVRVGYPPPIRTGVYPQPELRYPWDRTVE